MAVSSAMCRHGANGMRTYIVVAVLDQERDALALCALAARVALQLVLGGGDVVDQLAIGEAAAGQRVDDGRAPGVVLLNGLEDGQAGQGGRHSEKHSGVCAAGRDGGRVPAKRAREEMEVARPHGNGGAQDQRIRLQMQGVGRRQSCGGAVLGLQSGQGRFWGAVLHPLSWRPASIHSRCLQRVL